MATVSTTPLTRTTAVPAPEARHAGSAEAATATRRPYLAPTVAAAVGVAAAALTTWWVVVSFPLSMTVGGPGM